MKRKPNTVTLNLDAMNLPSLLATFSVANRVSIRQELKMVATIFKLGQAKISDAKISISTIDRQRTKAVKIKAKQLRDNFVCPDHVVIHWDGKIIQVMSGLTEDRVAVVLSSTSGIAGQFLASPVIPKGTGCAQATAVYEICRQWALTIGNAIKAMCFDTTASNSGYRSGAAVLLEIMIGYSIFYLACRHHIAELHISHANEDCRGTVDGRLIPL